MRRNVYLRVGIASIAMILLQLGCVSTPRPQPPGQHPGRFAGTVHKAVEAEYLLFLPPGYEARGAKRWPLIVFLHGAGERGTNVELVAKHGPPKRVATNPDFPFVVLSPQCPPGTTWNLDTLEALLDDTLSRHAIDPKRIYLTGLSMGGFGSWAWAAAKPERFAAVVPICGGGDPVQVWLASGPRREALAKLPIWCFHGAKDNVVALAESQRMIDAYQSIGNEARLTVYPDAGHDSWTETYANPELYSWLSKHVRP